MQHPAEYVPGGAGREVGHQNANPDAEGAGQGEHRRGQEEGGAAEVGLGEVEAEAEGHERLVHHHRQEDGQQLGRCVLDTDGNTWYVNNKH